MDNNTDMYYMSGSSECVFCKKGFKSGHRCPPPRSRRAEGCVYWFVWDEAKYIAGMTLTYHDRLKAGFSMETGNFKF